MRLTSVVITCISSLIVTGCGCKATNPADPFEPFNRKIYAFNTAFDTVLLKPTAKIYRAVLPALVRRSVNNFYNNLDLIPTVGNDLLQAQGKWAIRDSWRFVINSSLGVGGLFDVANTFGLAPHSNDLGLTLAHWGDVHSPYLVIPLLGPSTLRDGAGWLFQFSLYSPYIYLNNDELTYSLLAVRYIDLRSQLLDSDRIMDEALDKYSFLRDSYLQYRNHRIANNQPENYAPHVDDKNAIKAAGTDLGNDYVD